MHCASCAGLIEKSLNKTSGVDEVNVNFASEKARVKFNPNKINIEELERAVENA
jgi:P-type Cu+ transporter